MLLRHCCVAYLPAPWSWYWLPRQQICELEAYCLLGSRSATVIGKVIGGSGHHPWWCSIDHIEWNFELRALALSNSRIGAIACNSAGDFDQTRLPADLRWSTGTERGHHPSSVGNHRSRMSRSHISGRYRRHADRGSCECPGWGPPIRFAYLSGSWPDRLHRSSERIFRRILSSLCASVKSGATLVEVSAAGVAGLHRRSTVSTTLWRGRTPHTVPSASASSRPSSADVPTSGPSGRSRPAFVRGDYRFVIAGASGSAPLAPVWRPCANLGRR